MRKQAKLQPGPCPVVCFWHADSSSTRRPRRHPSPKAGSGLAPYSSWQLLVRTRKITCHGKAGVCSMLMWKNLQAIDLGNNVKPADTWKGLCWISNCVFLGPLRHVVSFFGWFSIGLLLQNFFFSQDAAILRKVSLPIIKLLYFKVVAICGYLCFEGKASLSPRTGKCTGGQLLSQTLHIWYHWVFRDKVVLLPHSQKFRR